MNFTAYERTLQGTGASRRLRLSGKVPGIVYGSGEPQTIELDHNALYFALKKEAFHSSVLEMELDGKVSQVLLRDFQMHPYKQLVQHIDFHASTRRPACARRCRCTSRAKKTPSPSRPTPASSTTSSRKLKSSAWPPRCPSSSTST